MRITALILVLCWSACLWAAYSPTTVTTIPWGDSAHQLKIGQPFWEDVEMTPEDTTDDAVFNSDGPDQGFVDFNDNFYFSSYGFAYLKGFDSNGELIVDFSDENQTHNREFYKSGISKFHVDENGLICFLSFPRLDYVALVDQNYSLVSKLNPYGVESGVLVSNFYRSADNVLSFYLSDGTRYKYTGGEFSEGGAMGWKASNGIYYYANMRDSATIRFIRYENPDLYGNPENLEEFLIPVENIYISYCEFLGVDENSNSFVDVITSDEENNEIVLIYDSEYKLIDEINFVGSYNPFYWIIPPFLRQDGVLFEFRVLEEGLEVIRWSKE